MNYRLSFLRGLGTALALACLTMAELEAGVSVSILSLDGPGEGLEDQAAFEPQGGNDAPTLGAARRRAVEFAAAVWANVLASDVPVRIAVSFDSLGGTAETATLGIAGAENVYRDFAGAPVAGTWYPGPLADKLAGVDLDGGLANDITAIFNIQVDGPTVLGPGRFYYGLDGNPPAGDVDFVSVVLHELAHGLGFHTYLDTQTGAKLFGYDDAFVRNLEHHGAPTPELALMTNAQRRAALVAGEDLHWIGPNALAEGTLLADGRSVDGHLEMYAPATVEPASSASHFSTAMLPEQVLEAFYVEPTQDLRLVLAVFADLGWGVAPVCEPAGGE